jgi:zinc D-Ala-D-Ala carboxypeptidase
MARQSRRIDVTQLSPHFTLEEMTFSQTASRQGINNTPSPEIVDHLRLLCAGYLEDVRSLLGYPIHISSGYRSLALNKAIGGAPTSAHMSGYAADFTMPPLNVIYVCQRIEASDLHFDQLIYEYTWIHLSVAPTMRRQVMTLQGHGYVNGIVA